MLGFFVKLNKHIFFLVLLWAMHGRIHGMQPLPPHERDRPNHNVRRDEPDSHQAEISAERRNQKVSKEKLPDDLHKLVFCTANQGPDEIQRICHKIHFLVTFMGVDVDILNDSKRTPLFYAVMFAKPNLDVIKTLLLLGADPEKIKEPDQIKQKLAEASHKEINELLSTQKRASDEELSRIKEDFMRRQKLCRKRARERAAQEVSSLAEAIILKEPSLVRKFLESENSTPEILSLALIELGKKSDDHDLEKSWEILFDLISKNRDLLKRRENGRTPLFDVVATRSLALVVQLLTLIEVEDELRNFINIRDDKGLNALNYAAQFEAQDIVDFLKSQGCSEHMPVRPRGDERTEWRRYRVRQVGAGNAAMAVIEPQPAEWDDNENIFHRLAERQRRERAEALAHLIMRAGQNVRRAGQNQPEREDAQPPLGENRAPAVGQAGGIPANEPLPRVLDGRDFQFGAQGFGGENRFVLPGPVQAQREVPDVERFGLQPAQVPQPNLQRDHVNDERLQGNAGINQPWYRGPEPWYRAPEAFQAVQPWYNANAPAVTAPYVGPAIHPIQMNSSLWQRMAVSLGAVVLVAFLSAYNQKDTKIQVRRTRSMIIR